MVPRSGLAWLSGRLYAAAAWILGDAYCRVHKAYTDCAVADAPGQTPCLDPLSAGDFRRVIRGRAVVAVGLMLAANLDLFGAGTATDRVSENAMKVMYAALGNGGGPLPLISFEGAQGGKEDSTTLPDVAVILIDETSVLADPGVIEWPLPYSRLADIVTALNRLNPPPAAVFFDIYWRTECGGRGAADPFINAILNRRPPEASLSSVLGIGGDVSGATGILGDQDPKFPVYVGGVTSLAESKRGADVVPPGETDPDICRKIGTTGAGFSQRLVPPKTLEETVLPKLAEVVCVVPVSWVPEFPDAYPLVVDEKTGKRPPRHTAHALAPMPAAAIYADARRGIRSSTGVLEADPSTCIGRRVSFLDRKIFDERLPSELSVVWRLDTDERVDREVFRQSYCALVNADSWDMLSFFWGIFLDALKEGVLGTVEHGGASVCPPNGFVPYSWLIGDMGPEELANGGLPTFSQAAENYLGGKVVMIGASALLTGDDVFAPGHGLIPGVFLHAMAYRNLVTEGDDYLKHRVDIPGLPMVDASDLIEFSLFSLILLISLPVATARARRDRMAGSEGRCGLDPDTLNRAIDIVQVRGVVIGVSFTFLFCFMSVGVLTLSPANWIGLSGAAVALMPGSVPAAFALTRRWLRTLRV